VVCSRCHGRLAASDEGRTSVPSRRTPIIATALVIAAVILIGIGLLIGLSLGRNARVGNRSIQTHPPTEITREPPTPDVVAPEDADSLRKYVVAHRTFGYRLGGHPYREMELLPDGTIGKGRAFEDRWRVPSKNTIAIGGANFESELVRCEDGTFRGVFPTGESMILSVDPTGPKSN
jgi:hypothetical protein